MKFGQTASVQALNDWYWKHTFDSMQIFCQILSSSSSSVS